MSRLFRGDGGPNAPMYPCMCCRIVPASGARDPACSAAQRAALGQACSVRCPACSKRGPACARAARRHRHLLRAARHRHLASAALYPARAARHRHLKRTQQLNQWKYKINNQSLRASNPVEGYKRFACDGIFSSSKNAKILDAKSRGCESSAKRHGIVLKIIPYQVAGCTGSVDRRAGGREHPHHPNEQRDASPESQDLRLRIRRRFAAALLPRLYGTKVPGHTTRAPPVGFELATNGIQLYAIANLDKTSEDNLDAKIARNWWCHHQWYFIQSNTQTRLHHRVYECLIQLVLRA